MTPTSIFIRPSPAPVVVLTTRDVEVLSAVGRYGYLTATHLHRLCFAETGERGCQRRLRILWAAGYLDRHFLQWMITGTDSPESRGRRPLYCLTHKARRDLARRGAPAAGALPSRGSQRAVGRIEHDLVVTDTLVSLEASGPHLVRRVTTESGLWREYRAWRRLGGKILDEVSPPTARGLVTDGAFELEVLGERLGFQVEVVRASVRGGNATLSRRMQEIARLNRLGYFEEVHGHASLRAVIFLTTSPQRASNLAALAKALSLSRRLFWFGSFTQRIRAGIPETDLLATDLFNHAFIDGNGETQTLNELVQTPTPRSSDQAPQSTDPPEAGHA